LLLQLKILRVFNQTDAGSSLDGTKREVLTVSQHKLRKNENYIEMSVTGILNATSGAPTNHLHLNQHGRSRRHYISACLFVCFLLWIWPMT